MCRNAQIICPGLCPRPFIRVFSLQGTPSLLPCRSHCAPWRLPPAQQPDHDRSINAPWDKHAPAAPSSLRKDAQRGMSSPPSTARITSPCFPMTDNCGRGHGNLRRSGAVLSHPPSCQTGRCIAGADRRCRYHQPQTVLEPAQQALHAASRCDPHPQEADRCNAPTPALYAFIPAAISIIGRYLH